MLNETVVHKFISQKSTVADAVALFVVKEIWFLNFDHDLYSVQIIFGKLERWQPNISDLWTMKL